MLFEDYRRERALDLAPVTPKEAPKDIPNPEPLFVSDKHLRQLPKISQLHHDHPAKAYIVSRQIPNYYHSVMRFCPKFKMWTNQIIPGKFDPEKIGRDESRIIIPLFDRNGQMFGYQGRALDLNNELRYITIMVDESSPRFFGLDRVDFNKRWYITEGPVDSMFLSNAVASCGGKLVRELALLGTSIDNAVTVYDNEPRSKDIIKGMRQARAIGTGVCVWPDWVQDKDINAMILNQGWQPEFVQGIIDDNTHHGLKAELAINSWKIE